MKMSEDTSKDSKDDAKKKETNPLARQIFASVGPIFVIAFGGMVGGSSTIFSDQIDENSTPISMNIEQSSWIAAVPPLFMALGCFFCGWSMERFGRQYSNILATVLLVAGWAIIYFANSFELLVAGRAITGFAVGATTTGPSVYMGEIVDPKRRQAFIAVANLGLASGFLISHALGAYLGWAMMSLVAMVLTTICIVFFAVVPESHVWYIKRNELGKAQKAFYWFRGESDNSQQEINKLFNDSKSTTKGSVRQLIADNYNNPQLIKPLIIMGVFFFTLQFSGNNAVLFHSITIVTETVHVLDKYSAMLIIDGVRIIMSVLGCILSKRYYVRPLIFVSGFGSCFSLLFVALFSYLDSVYPNNEIIVFMPLIGLVSYIGFINIGFRPLANVLSAELFHPDTKGFGAGVTTGLNFLMFFVIVKINPDMMRSLGATGTFAIYGLCLFLGTTVLFYILPETKNKSLDEIQQSFKRTT